MKLKLTIPMGLLSMLLSFSLGAKDINQLKSLELHSIAPNKIELSLEFSEPPIFPKSFSIDTPPSIVFDFPATKNNITKETLPSIPKESILKAINIAKTTDKTRMILDVQHIVPFQVSTEGNFLRIDLEGDSPKEKQASNKYSIQSFDFRRGERGEAKIIVDLSLSDISIDLKEEKGDIIAEFINASLADKLMKRYDVTDFATPVKTIDITKKDQNIEMIIHVDENYDKIAYQMDKQFIIEVRSKTEEEKLALKNANGQYAGDKISLNFQDIEIRAILQIIADFSGFNIIASDNVKGNITLRLQDVPWDQALDIILKSEGLDKRTYGNVMLVGPATEIAAREKIELEGQKQIQDLGPMRSELIAIKYADGEDLASLLKDKSNSLMTSRGTVSVDKRTNTLLIQDVDTKLSEIHALIDKLDVPVRQVEISTQIVTADNTLENTLGIRFGGGANAGIGHKRLGIGASVDRARAIADYTDPLGASSVPPSNAVLDNTKNMSGNIADGPTLNNTEGLFSDLGAITSGTIFGAANLSPAKAGLALAKLPNGTLLDLELQALEYETRSKTIARPKLVTMDQNKATVEKGVDIPYLQASSSGATSVAYKTAALKLEVTPHITPDDKISLDLQISNDTQGANVSAGPVVNTNRLETKVLVDNGETVVLGGVLSIVDNKQWAKVPFLGDLPIVGTLFRNRYAQYSPKELIIFLTPKILTPIPPKE